VGKGQERRGLRGKWRKVLSDDPGEWEGETEKFLKK